MGSSTNALVFFCHFCGYHQKCLKLQKMFCVNLQCGIKTIRFGVLLKPYRGLHVNIQFQLWSMCEDIRLVD